MKVLVYVPQARRVRWSLDSVLRMDSAGHQVTRVFDAANNERGIGDWYDVALYKMRIARDWALRGGYDALMTVEDDIIVPAHALERLANTGADVAYGLTVWRNAPHKWSATYAMEWARFIDTAEQHERGREAMRDGEYHDTLGCGFFCTLIRRRVLEAFDFRRMDNKAGAADWPLAFDTRDHGFKQGTHYGVVCGHVEPTNTPHAFYPDWKQPPYWRVEALG